MRAAPKQQAVRDGEVVRQDEPAHKSALVRRVLDRKGDEQRRAEYLALLDRRLERGERGLAPKIASMAPDERHEKTDLKREDHKHENGATKEDLNNRADKRNEAAYDRDQQRADERSERMRETKIASLDDRKDKDAERKADAAVEKKDEATKERIEDRKQSKDDAKKEVTAERDKERRDEKQIEQTDTRTKK
jgi:hypothetical protein